MTMFYNRDTQLHDLSADSAYRSYLISRNQSPIVYHSSDRALEPFSIERSMFGTNFPVDRLVAPAEPTRSPPGTSPKQSGMPSFGGTPNVLTGF